MAGVLPDMSLEIPAVIDRSPDVYGWLDAVLASEELEVADPAVREEIKLAVHEIWVNIVEHAYDGMEPGSAAFRAYRQGPQVVFELRDHGQGFDPDTVAAPQPEALQEGGFGLFLVERLMDEMSYERMNEMNNWKLVKTC